MPIEVVIVDDHKVCAQTLAQAIARNGIGVTAIAKDWNQAFELFVKVQPALALVNSRQLRGMDHPAMDCR